ncbi:hypothetical protein PACTADRAFT_14270 [Pachysolen tannophilus NRRL Y-2460]|uniref:Uncharacterized protein n=1 Tax=Pachysolen tannophilus NRRL Y-2460 TaxID=669874 RepID=A0A1E4U188_PACTA|nr:hypothetical protein PACTADRAFT_14270 [Pachysolen tannophilus NRRL Y-2460]
MKNQIPESESINKNENIRTLSTIDEIYTCVLFNEIFLKAIEFAKSIELEIKTAIINLLFVQIDSAMAAELQEALILVRSMISSLKTDSYPKFKEFSKNDFMYSKIIFESAVNRFLSGFKENLMKTLNNYNNKFNNNQNECFDDYILAEKCHLIYKFGNSLITPSQQIETLVELFSSNEPIDSFEILREIEKNFKIDFTQILLKNIRISYITTTIIHLEDENIKNFKDFFHRKTCKDTLENDNIYEMITESYNSFQDTLVIKNNFLAEKNDIFRFLLENEKTGIYMAVLYKQKHVFLALVGLGLDYVCLLSSIFLKVTGIIELSNYEIAIRSYFSEILKLYAEVEVTWEFQAKLSIFKKINYKVISSLIYAAESRNVFDKYCSTIYETEPFKFTSNFDALLCGEIFKIHSFQNSFIDNFHLFFEKDPLDNNMLLIVDHDKKNFYEKFLQIKEIFLDELGIGLENNQNEHSGFEYFINIYKEIANNNTTNIDFKQITPYPLMTMDELNDMLDSITSDTCTTTLAPL